MARFGKDKNRTHDGPWLLAAQRHVLQALEILTGGHVRIDNFDTVTLDYRCSPPHFEERTFSLTATIVGDKFGGGDCPRVVTATISKFQKDKNVPWKIGFVGVIFFTIKWTEKSESVHFAVFDYESVRKGLSVVPRVCVGTDHVDSRALDSMFNGCKMVGTSLADRQTLPVPIRYLGVTTGMENVAP